MSFSISIEIIVLCSKKEGVSVAKSKIITTFAPHYAKNYLIY
jgi:hypothetical protein